MQHFGLYNCCSNKSLYYNITCVEFINTMCNIILFIYFIYVHNNTYIHYHIIIRIYYCHVNDIILYYLFNLIGTNIFSMLCFIMCVSGV